MKTKTLIHWRVTFWVDTFTPYNFMSLVTCLKRLKKVEVTEHINEISS